MLYEANELLRTTVATVVELTYRELYHLKHSVTYEYIRTPYTA